MNQEIEKYKQRYKIIYYSLLQGEDDKSFCRGRLLECALVLTDIFNVSTKDIEEIENSVRQSLL